MTRPGTPSQPAPDSRSGPSVTVAVVCICSARHLERCLEGLRAQEGAGPFDVVVRHDPAIPGIDAVAARFPDVRIGCRADQGTPLDLASAVLHDSYGDVVLLTEDHCIPRNDWVRTMLAARAPGRAAVGGRMEIRAHAPALDWAFYYVDFYRYAGPVREGPSPSLTVCNVVYERDRLEAVREVWDVRFEEAAVHQALQERFGPLWLTPDSEVTMRRSVAWGPALYERYAFGRIFGQTRTARLPASRRLLYAAAAPALPALLLWRMTSKAMRSPALLRAYLRALVPVVALVLSWSWGELLGYVTGRPPRALVVSPERGD